MIAENTASPEWPRVKMWVETDPVQIAEARAQQAKFDRNWEWFLTQVPGIYEAHRGKIICISGKEVFAADTTEEAVARAEAAHPDDDGRFTMIIPRERMLRIYAYSRRMAAVQ